MGRPASEETQKRIQAMQEDRDNGMTAEQVALKYGLSLGYVKHKTRRHSSDVQEKKPIKRFAKEWDAIDKQLIELVKISEEVRRKNKAARKPRDISAFGHTFRS